MDSPYCIYQKQVYHKAVSLSTAQRLFFLITTGSQTIREENQHRNKEIYQKLQTVRQNVLAMKEDAQGYGYSYVSEENILSNITGVMQKVGLSLIPSVVPGAWKFTPRTYEKSKIDKAGVRPDRVQ